MASIEMINGDMSPTGVESFTVIDFEKQANGDGDAYQLDESFVFSNLIHLPIDDLVERVKELSLENQQFKECMERSNTSMKDINTRISQKFYGMRAQNTDLKSENQLLKSRVHELETDAQHSERERCQSLSQEIQLVKGCEESEVQKNASDPLMEFNQQLAADLSSARASLDGLLIDLQNVQKLKNSAEEQYKALYAENNNLREQLSKVTDISSKIVIEKREVLHMNVLLERELEEMRRLTENLDRLPISLMPSNFPKLLENDEEKTEYSTSSGDLKEEEICSTDAGPPSLEHDIDEDVLDFKVTACTEDTHSTDSCHKSTNTVDFHIASVDKEIEEVQRLLSEESLITTEGRRALLAKIDLLLNELTARVGQCAELTSELTRQRIEFKSKIRTIVDKSQHSESIAASAKDEAYHYELRIANLQMEISELRKQIAAQSTECKEFKEISLQSSFSHEVAPVLRESVPDDSSISSMDKTQIHQLRNRCKSIEKENNSLKSSKNQAENTHQAVIAASNEHMHMIKNDIRKLQSEVAWLREDNVVLKKKCDRELQENSYMTMVTKELREKVEELNSELQAAQEDLDAMTSERESKMKELLAHQQRTDEICQQYHFRAANSESLENLLSQKEVECSEYREEIERLGHELRALQRNERKSNEERELFKTQSEIYLKDFQDERQSREQLVQENGTLTAQVATLQQELVTFSRYNGSATAYPEASQPYWMNYARGTQPYPNHSGGTNKEGARMQECPMCFERFADLLSLQRHVQQCSL